MIHFMREGGLMMWVLLLLATPTLAMALVHAIAARRWSLAAALAPLALVVVLALLANLHGKSRVAEALASGEIDPSQRAVIERVGDAEAARPWQLALGILAVVIVPIGVGEVRRVTRKGG